MWSCFPPIHIRSNKKSPQKQKWTQHHAVAIEVYTGMILGAASWRIAILSFDPTTDSNLISPKLVTEVLGMTIHPLDGKEGELPYEQFKGQEMNTQGYIDLAWCFQRSRTVYNTRFVVTTTYNPPFDAVLGRKSAVEIGLAKSQR
ncbi:hypothetical protein H2201_004137 [Coniosporium apollinis]|uniref:Uncharacterized protein n=1 Tax=Coniosporium apollinis TaxID=61459 RepID=A0ABQ9NUP4_9PEZI|nr:hypothetical protein H2201_004137 [Coniosporium apollinis]